MPARTEAGREPVHGADWTGAATDRFEVNELAGMDLARNGRTPAPARSGRYRLGSVRTRSSARTGARSEATRTMTCAGATAGAAASAR